MKYLKRSMIIVTLILALSFLAGIASSIEVSAETQLSDEQKIYGLSHFWSEARYNFVYFDQVPELDWDNAYQEYIPQVLATKSTFEYYRVLQRFCALLADGHTHVYYPQEVYKDQQVFPEITLREIDHRAIITGIDSSVSTEIPVGSEIIEIDGVPSLEHLSKNIFPYMCVSTEHSLWTIAIQGWNFARIGMLSGPLNSEVKLTIVDPAGKRHTVTAKRTSDIPNPSDRYTIKGIMSKQVTDLVNFRWIEENDLAYLAINSVMGGVGVEEQFMKALPELQKAKGLVIDIRENHGGSSWISRQIATQLTSDTLIGPIARSRSLGGFADRQIVSFKDKLWHYAAPDTIAAKPDVKLDIPIVILMGYGTASGAEEFLLLMDPLDNVTFVGTKSYGSTGQPLNLSLPGGGQAQICSKRNSYPDGKEFVGFGIQPDEIVKMTVDALIEGRDPALEKGIQILSNK